MTKRDLVKSVANELETSQVVANECIKGVFKAVATALENGEEVNINGFGKFTIKERAARTCRNPQTGDPIEVPATKVCKFKPAAALKEAVK